MQKQSNENNEKKQPYNLQIAMEGAKGFEKAARIMNQEAQYYHGAISSAVNFALAIELNLKILYYLDKQELAPFTHKLIDLFNTLNENTKIELVSDFENLIKASNSIDNQTTEIFNKYENSLVGFLEYADKIFVSWRYYGLDSTSPQPSGLVGVDACLKALKTQITKKQITDTTPN